MLWTLIKKQFSELGVSIYHDARKGKRRSKSGILLYALLYVYVFGMLGFSMYTMANGICVPMMEIGSTWMFYALMGLMASVLGILGTAFTTNSIMYSAKDNDLLLSMPIPPSNILFSRLISCYIIAVVMEAIVHIPTFIVGFKNIGFSVSMLVFDILLLFIGPVFILALSCILGYLIAFLSTRVKNKSLVTLIISIVFIAAYMYVYSNLMDSISMILVYAKNLEGIMGTWLFALKLFAFGCMGEGKGFALFALMTFAFMAIVFIILKRSFIKLVTTKKGFAKTKYKTDMVKTGTYSKALLRKEFGRFKASPTYMLNCGLGTIVMIVAAVFLVIKGSMLSTILDSFGVELKEMEGAVILGALCVIACMNDITAPSVSMEGKSFWVIRSLPVRSLDVLKTKLKLHLLFTLIPQMILGIAVCLILKPGIVPSLIALIGGAAFTVLNGGIGLMTNLRRPNFNWNNEVAEIKQSACVAISLFSGMGIAMGSIALAIWGGIKIGGLLTESLLAIALVGAASFVYYRITTKGVEIWETL